MLVVFFLGRHVSVANFEEVQRQQVRNFAAVAEQALAVSDTLFMVNYLKVLNKMPGVSYAYVSNVEDVILVHSDRKFIYKKLEEWDKVKPRKSFERSLPVFLSTRYAGQACMGFSRTYLEEATLRAVRGILKIILLIAVGGIALGFLGAWILAMFITRPIRDLAAGSEELSKGNLKTRIAVYSKDELGDLASRFNQTAERLQELDQLKDQFISTVSHDLRSPLAAIKMHVERLLRSPKSHLDEDQKDKLQVCYRATARLSIFINNMLDLAKIKAGKMECQFYPIPLAVCVDSVLELFESIAQHRRITISLNLDPRLPMIRADKQRVEQILSNLLSNALKFTPEGGKAEILGRYMEGEKMVEVAVADTGPGIPPEDLPNLFNRFYQSGKTGASSDLVHGTGLGLMIAKQAVDSHGGKIWVESELGRGTTFHFALPAVSPKDPSAGTD